MNVLRKHHSSSYNNHINMKFVQLALLFLPMVVLVLAAPPNRQNKPFRPNPRIHSRAVETTTFRTYQPKYNPFKSTVSRTFTSSPNSTVGIKAYMPMRSEVRFRHNNLIKKLSIDTTPISVPVEEPVAISTTDTNFPWQTKPEWPSILHKLESFSSPPPSDDPLGLLTDSVSSSPLPPVPFAQEHVMSKSPASTTSEFHYSTVSSSELTSSSITKRPVLLRPLTSSLLKPQLKTPKSSTVSSIRTFSFFESIPSSTPKSLFSALPRPNTLDPSSHVFKALASPSSPKRTSSVTTSSPSKDHRPSINPVSSTNSEPKSKTPVSSVSSTAVVPLSLRNSKSVRVQTGSDDYTRSEPTTYSFAYKVNDPSTKQDFGHREKRVGNITKGRYDVLLPDGRRQVVDYQVLDDLGYFADITYQSS